MWNRQIDQCTRAYPRIFEKEDRKYTYDKLPCDRNVSLIQYANRIVVTSSKQLQKKMIVDPPSPIIFESILYGLEL